MALIGGGGAGNVAGGNPSGTSGTLVYVGNNISQYWMEFLQERISVGHGILDNVGLLKCEFLKRKEHIFGITPQSFIFKSDLDVVSSGERNHFGAYRHGLNQRRKQPQKGKDRERREF